MSFPISDADATYLLKMISEGNAMPVLGAGASVSSTNSKNQSIPMSAALAQKLCHSAGIPYENDELKDVLDAINGDKILSTKQIMDVYNECYRGCKPSQEYEELFLYTWRRLYMWNVDDLAENIKGKRVQVVRLFNGMIDKASEFDSHEYLHAIYLHGQVTKPEHKLIFTQSDYLGAINGSWHHWYKRIAQDYFSVCPIIIGSSLNEPILAAEIDRVKRETDSQVGRAFLITPDNLTQIRQSALRSHGVVHIKGTLEDFVGWLKVKIPGGNTPVDVLRLKNAYSDTEISQLSRSDIAVAHSLYPISSSELRLSARQVDEADVAARARQFLNGFPPSWSLVASEIPVYLKNTGKMYEALSNFIASDGSLFVVTGQSGSGKSTALMQCVLKYVSDNPKTPAFEMSSDVKSVTSAFRLINKLHPDGAIVFIRDIFVFGDTFVDDLEAVKGTNLHVVSTARSHEWRDRLSRYLGKVSEQFVFERFLEDDIEPLISKILTYVPTPRFRRLSLIDQKKRLRASRSQLLIALREVTESDNFSNVITHEYNKLPDDDTKGLLLIVGMATLARVGISEEMAKEVYERLSVARTFSSALDALTGIVSLDKDSRLFARHELYVRHIIENMIPFERINSVIISMMRYYVKYNIPIVRSVGRRDGLLFRAILNHRFIAENERRKRADREGISIYQAFEVEFQLDGHFWLQYGLYLANRGEIVDALLMLRRSIDAYPDNPFAVHAYADVQLRFAAERSEYDSATKDIIASAVASLKKMDAETSLDVDVYPVVTLAYGHISALVKHNDKAEAIKVSKEYHERLKQVERVVLSRTVTNARERVFRFATLGEWQERYDAQKRKRNDGRRRRGRK